jgi:hypothetical protein
MMCVAGLLTDTGILSGDPLLGPLILTLRVTDRGAAPRGQDGLNRSPRRSLAVRLVATNRRAVRPDRGPEQGPTTVAHDKRTPLMRASKMTKVTTALKTRAKAQSLRATANALDAAPVTDPLASEFMRHDAAQLETGTASALALDNPPAVGAGGELVPAGDQIARGTNFINTVERPDAVAAEASMDRLRLADDGIQCVAMAVDAAETIQARNSIEKMLAHQLAAAHKLAMTFAGKARQLVEDEGGPYQQDGIYVVEAARVANSSARMMDAFQKGALALHKLRTGGKQTVTVQHVNVNDGGQAVVTGGIKAGGGDD